MRQRTRQAEARHAHQCGRVTLARKVASPRPEAERTLSDWSRYFKEKFVSPQKMLRRAFGIRALSSSYIQRVFIKTEMMLKSRSVITGSSRTLHRSKSSENLPSSQSQINCKVHYNTDMQNYRRHYPNEKLRHQDYHPRN
ncbi:hypothetical protein PGB90_010612 [Kerria lacca]